MISEHDEKAQRLIDKLGEEWYEKLKDDFERPYMITLQKEIAATLKRGVPIFPKLDDMFRAFLLTPFSKVKVVWILQDPYMDANASGLAMECKIRRAPTFNLVYDEYNRQYPSNFNTKLMDGDLSGWAEAGVLLFNTALTVPADRQAGHIELWRPFITHILELLIYDARPKAFVLLGSFAHQFSSWVTSPHIALCYEHPAYAARERRPWKAEGIFEKINMFLMDNKIEPVKWDL